MSVDDADFWTTWGREFCDAIRPLAPNAVGQDAYEVAALAFDGAPRRSDLLAAREAELERLRKAAVEVLELQAVDIDLIRKAVEATRLYWSERH